MAHTDTLEIIRWYKDTLKSLKARNKDLQEDLKSYKDAGAILGQDIIKKMKQNKQLQAKNKRLRNERKVDDQEHFNVVSRTVDMREALEDCRGALTTLPRGALGKAIDAATGETAWYLRDELMDKITKALKG